MYIQIETNASGYILIGLSCIFVVVYLCLVIWRDNHGRSHMAEEVATIERLRKSQKILAEEPKGFGDSLWKILK